MIEFRHADGLTFSESTTLCDGSQQAVIDALSCVIPSSSFTQEPYALAWGSSVYARVKATNVKGENVESLPGNGAVILRTPDAPVNLQNVVSITSGSKVGLTWQEGSNNGGTAVIDFQIMIAYWREAVGAEINVEEDLP